LRKTYGPEYEQFCANVPRWILRLRPWRRDRQQDWVCLPDCTRITGNPSIIR